MANFQVSLKSFALRIATQEVIRKTAMIKRGKGKQLGDVKKKDFYTHYKAHAKEELNSKPLYNSFVKELLSAFSNAIVETVYALTGTDIDPNNGTTQTKTITTAPTFPERFVSGESVSLHLTDASSYIITWPTITWITDSGNIAPTLTAADTIVLFKIGTTLYGVWIGSSA